MYGLADPIDRQVRHPRCKTSAALQRLIIDLGKRLAIGLIVLTTRCPPA
jgi:hypothetical protein